MKGGVSSFVGKRRQRSSEGWSWISTFRGRRVRAPPRTTGGLLTWFKGHYTPINEIWPVGLHDIRLCLISSQEVWVEWCHSKNNHLQLIFPHNPAVCCKKTWLEDEEEQGSQSYLLGWEEAVSMLWPQEEMICWIGLTSKAVRRSGRTSLGGWCSLCVRQTSRWKHLTCYCRRLGPNLGPE